MRILFLIIAFTSLLFANWCVVHSSQKRVHGKEDEIFFRDYPLGFISNDGKWIRFVSGPYQTKSEAKKVLGKTKHRYPSAYIIHCDRLHLKNVRKSIVF